ncbi:MAG: hypothetical protein A2583_05005 [Bdellovibrionales bacterium RIFOXYD1_FULL_53_11]|nr:MAG: hypothetical protein A2583_05005 [Bdellovibrionales bacterium RIFOXYD1_FULL_53_11]
MKNLFYKYVLDVLFITIAALCFGFFMRGAFMPPQTGSAGAAVARIKSGGAERKRSGMVVFKDVGPGTELFHRDAVWVGPGGQAEIVFDSDDVLKVGEKTLFIITRRAHARGAVAAVDVLHGRVEKAGTASSGTQGETGLSIRQADEKSGASSGNELDWGVAAIGKPLPPGPVQPSGPSAIDGAVAQKQVAATGPTATPEDALQIYPAPDTAFYVASKKRVVEIVFSWLSPVDGQLVVNSPDGGTSARIALSSMRQNRVDLKVGHKYTWSIEKNGIINPQIGTRAFEVRIYDGSKAQGMFDHGLKGKVEIIQ